MLYNESDPERFYVWKSCLAKSIRTKHIHSNDFLPDNEQPDCSAKMISYDSLFFLKNSDDIEIIKSCYETHLSLVKAYSSKT